MFRNLTDAALKTYYTIPERSWLDRVGFPVTKSYTETHIALGHWSKWDKISEGLILGKIPSEAECKELMAFSESSSFNGKSASASSASSSSSAASAGNHSGRPLRLIVSVVDYFELGGAFPLRPIATPKDWESRGVL